MLVGQSRVTQLREWFKDTFDIITVKTRSRGSRPHTYIYDPLRIYQVRYCFPLYIMFRTKESKIKTANGITIYLLRQ
jgi:hypothetical protein